MWYFLDPFQAHWAVSTIQLLVAAEPTFLLAIAGVLVCGGPSQNMTASLPLYYNSGVTSIHYLRHSLLA